MKRILPVVIVSIMLAVFTLPAFAAGSTMTINTSVNSASKVVEISGMISPASASAITVVVKNPSGELDYVDQITSRTDGIYFFSYKLDETAGGTYAISIGCNGTTSVATFTYVVFSDAEGNWAHKAIMELAKAGILNGYSDGTVKPNANATRAEFVNMVMKLMKQEAKTTTVFCDIHSSAWYMKALSLAVEKGWIKGRDDGCFGPDERISREEAIAIISRVLDSLGVKAPSDISVLDAYSDSLNISDWAKTDVAKLVGLGIIKGSDGRINPKADITRAEISTILVRILEGYINK